MSYQVVATSDSYQHITDVQTSFFAGMDGGQDVHDRATPATRDIVNELIFNLPDVTWVLEVDLFGRHRVTIHFKGAEIGIDAIDAG